MKCFAHGSSANLKPSSNVGLSQMVTWFEYATPDRLAQNAIGIVAEDFTRLSPWRGSIINLVLR